ncbi:MAG TPA: hypothetical protein VIU45_07720 [Chitinophagaceae bacterium]
MPQNNKFRATSALPFLGMLSMPADFPSVTQVMVKYEARAQAKYHNGKNNITWFHDIRVLKKKE